MSLAQRRSPRLTLVLATAFSAVATLAIAALLTNITERRVEARSTVVAVTHIDDDTVDPAEWGKNFPLHYELYKSTVDMERTRYGGSEAIPRQPTPDDPREQVSASRLEEDPRLREFWAGYAFAEDFREERGHAYMLVDQQFTKRQVVAEQPGTCIHCHASTYKAYRDLGDGDLEAGFAKLNQMPYAEAVKHVEHPVACIDCHEPSSMKLRVTRPAFMEGMRVLKQSEGVADYDVNRDATAQEMRSFVCGQCHVEYYFKGEEKRLTYPWHKGLRADQILSYYEEVGFADWTHEKSGAPVLKAQHPEFEMWSQGIHAQAGVSCVDCHMPYERQGARKVSNHQVRSPLLNVSASCQTCHRTSEEELLARVHRIQDRTYQVRNLAIDAVLSLTDGIAAAAKEGAPEDRVTAARGYQRKAQFLTDFVEAENSMGFHADQEAMRVLALALDHARKGEKALRGELPSPAGEEAGVEEGAARPGAPATPPPQTVTPAP